MANQDLRIYKKKYNDSLGIIFWGFGDPSLPNKKSFFKKTVLNVYLDFLCMIMHMKNLYTNKT